MAIYSIARTGTVVTSGQAVFDVGAGAGVRGRIMEIGLFLGAATASTYGLNRPSAIGTRTSPVVLLAEDPADPASECDTAIAWSVQPTFGANDYRLIGLPATIGTGVIWTFPRGLTIAASGSIAVVNRATNSASLQAYAVVDE
jgi:hypothetical protein